MAIAFGAKVQGGQALQAKLKSLAKRTATKACRAGVNEGSKIVLKESKGYLKRGAGRRRTGTGLLLKSLGRKLYTKKGTAVAITGPRTGFRTTRKGRVRTALGAKFEAAGVTPTRYAHLVEKGRKGVVAGIRSEPGRGKARKRGERVTIKTGKKTLKFIAAGGNWVSKRQVAPAAPRPFMGPAISRHRAEVMDASAKATWEAIERDARK